MALPGGTLTFLFTDIVGSTVLWEEHPDEMAEIVPAHDSLIGAAVEAHGGNVFKTVGDAVCAVFETAGSAIEASVQAQQLLSDGDWLGAARGVDVRMGIHTGIAQQHGDSDYLGPTLNRVARLVDAGHGRQILISESSQSLVEYPSVDLGRHQLKGLARPERIYEVQYEGCPEEFPPLRTVLASTAGNLPINLEPLFGRASELESVVGAMRAHPVVTLTGPGGVGKTRLALEAASKFGEVSVRHGAWVIELAPLGANSDISVTVASTLSIQVEGGRSIADSVVAALVSRESLIVLDNVEHVLDSARELTARIASSCPDIRMLVTSREPMGVRGERVVRVPPLESRTTEGDGSQASPAVQLLQHRITLGGGVLDSSQSTVDALTHIAQRLDGLPLALELAAARSAVLGIDGLIARLDGQLNLLADRSAIEERHATLHATIDWSHELLDELEREVFRRFSVFADGCTLEAVEAVCASSAAADAAMPGFVLDAMDHLTGASMIDVGIDDLGRSRFTMLESLRQYGQMQLDKHEDNSAARETHARYYRELAGQVAQRIRGSELRATRTVDIELANFRAAHEWGLITDDPGLYLEIPAVFGYWYFQTGRSGSDEMIGWLDAGLERESACTSPLYSIALSIGAEMAGERGEVDRREKYLDTLRSLQPLEDLPFDARAVFDVTEFYDGRLSLEDHEARLEASRHDPHDEIQSRLLLSLSYTYQRADHDRAIQHANRLLELSDRHQLADMRAWSLFALAEAFQSTEPERARVMLDEAVAISQDWHIGLINAVSRVSLTTANMQLGNYAEAARILSDVINEWHLRGNWRHQWVALRNAVELVADAGQGETAARLLHAIGNSPSSNEVFGTQADRLHRLTETYPLEAVVETMSDDQIIRSVTEVLDGIATKAV